MANQTATYRNRDSGEVRVYPRSLAKHFPYLVEVAEDAKPLAYVPIPREAIDALRGKLGVADEDAPVFTDAVARFDADPTDVLDPDEDPEDFTPDDQPDSGEEGDNA